MNDTAALFTCICSEASLDLFQSGGKTEVKSSGKISYISFCVDSADAKWGRQWQMIVDNVNLFL